MLARLARRPVRAALLVLGFSVLVQAAANATWSIVLVDKQKGEVAIGCATCLTDTDLELLVPVMLVGIGGACAQSQVDSSGENRRLIWDRMIEGKKPVEIIMELADIDPAHQRRQYGIVDLQGRRQTFTGSRAGPWAGGVEGRTGSIYYAIQGNVLTGQPVVDAALDAIENTSGDLAEKLMAGMEAAQLMGGDGRCSCDQGGPDDCGSPPPDFDPDQDKSAHVGFMMISRIGDVDGDCAADIGCANGTYYMNLNVADQGVDDPDPVIQLRGLFDDWRESWRGRPDHILSTKALTPNSTPGNGTNQVTLTLELRDWEDNPLGHGGAAVTVTHSADSAGLSAIGTPVDLGDGTYTVPITAGVGQGIDEFEIVVDDGQGPVTLYPFPTLDLTQTLTADRTSMSAAAGGTVNFELFGPNTPPPEYLLLCSASGTSPGIPLCQVVVPINLDAMVILSYILRNTDVFVNTDAALASDGTSWARFTVDPGELDPIIGFELDFAFFTHGPVEFASNYVPLVVDP
jgi:hypothetical protein